MTPRFPSGVVRTGFVIVSFHYCKGERFQKRAAKLKRGYHEAEEAHTVKIDEKTGCERVLVNALGVGEGHTGVEGRNYVKTLIEKNLVRHLILEIPQNLGMQVRELPVDKVASYIGDLWGNEASPLGKLVECARRSKDLWIGCYDIAGGDEGETFLNSRDAQVAEKVNELMTQYGRQGTVILFGAMHFEDRRNAETREDAR
jgi:hypothetical protein